MCLKYSAFTFPLKKWLVLLHYWVREFPVTTATLDAETHKGSAINAYQWFREICSTALLNTPIILGGTGKIVEIDESLFRHKPKVYHYITHSLYNIITTIFH